MTTRSLRHDLITIRSDMELGHWVTGSMGHLGHLSRPGHRVTGPDPVWDPSFSGFRKNSQNAERWPYIRNAEMTKVIVGCLLLDWNHWTSVHAMNFYFYLWLLKIPWPENTSSHISRHLEFIIEQGHRVNWVSGSLGRWVTKCDPVPSLTTLAALAPIYSGKSGLMSVAPSVVCHINHILLL